MWAVCNGDKRDNEVLRDHFDEVRNAYGALGYADRDSRGHLLSCIKRAEAVPFSKSVLEAMATMPVFHASADAFDADTSVLVTPDGVVNCESPWPLLPHSSARLVMRCTRGSLKPERRDGTRWAQFMREVFPDQEMHDFMRRLLGYIVFGHRREHVCRSSSVAAATARAS